MIEQPGLVGLSEIAEMAGVSKQAVTNWRSRHPDFPHPIAELRSGPVWGRRDFLAWAEEHQIPIHVPESKGSREAREGDKMAVTVSLVNMKGGVGKSTLAANLGWYCTYRKSKRVLLVDLDPQFNLSQYVLGHTRYEDLIRDGNKTVFHIFEQLTPAAVSGSPRLQLSPSDVTVNVVPAWESVSRRLDLLPSQLELAWTLKNPHDKEQLLKDHLDHVKPDYDLILIDCAPTESMLTSAAYLASDYILVPVKPEFLSTIGLPLLVRSLEEFRMRHKEKEIELLGIVFNAAGEKLEHGRSRDYVTKVAADNGWYVFTNEVTFSDSYAKGSRLGRPIFQTDYARGQKIQEFANVAEEFCARIGL